MFTSRSAPMLGEMALLGGTPSPVVRLASLRFFPSFRYAFVIFVEAVTCIAI
jgi:hypothetical protein